jgi:hypothetical protein
VPHTYAQTINKAHGRIEIRECRVIERLDYVEALRTAEDWAELRSLIMVKAEGHRERIALVLGCSLS